MSWISRVGIRKTPYESAFKMALFTVATFLLVPADYDDES